MVIYVSDIVQGAKPVNKHGPYFQRGFPGGSVVKNLPVDAGDTGDAGSIPGSGRSPGGRHGNPLQYSCLENPMDRGAWWATELDTTEVT